MKPNRNDYVVVSATQKSNPLDTDLGKSLEYFDIILDVKTENTEGLTSVYNNFIEKWWDKKYIIFAHDDLFIESVNFLDKLQEQFDKGFSVVGLAGGSKCKKEKPFLWHLVTKKETQSGIVYHRHNVPDIGSVDHPTVFGPAPKEVALLDGLFIAIDREKIISENILFDEKIKGFHFYDLKFSIDCKKAGLRLTTALIKTIHNSHGLSKGPDEKFKQAEEYLFSTL